MFSLCLALPNELHSLSDAGFELDRLHVKVSLLKAHSLMIF